MVELGLKVFPAGPLSTNNYLVFDKSSRKGFIIDLSSFSGELFDFLEKEKIEIDFVALTHAHFDHIEGLSGVDFPFYLQKEDCQFLLDPEKNGSAFFSEPVRIDKKPFLYQKKLFFQENEIRVIKTPGHSPGSVSLKLGGWLFTGDTLFCQSIGRTDIPLASGELILDSIKNKIMPLADDLVIYPGHGPDSTLAREKQSNPFLSA